VAAGTLSISYLVPKTAITFALTKSPLLTPALSKLCIDGLRICFEVGSSMLFRESFGKNAAIPPGNVHHQAAGRFKPELDGRICSGVDVGWRLLVVATTKVLVEPHHGGAHCMGGCTDGRVKLFVRGSGFSL
jgi:hypothetical protein